MCLLASLVFGYYQKVRADNFQQTAENLNSITLKLEDEKAKLEESLKLAVDAAAAQRVHAEEAYKLAMVHAEKNK